jgi:ferric-dicitrate binding protein FerR (iron transport regulator)
MTIEENSNSEERDIARLLQAAGRREELPEAVKASWESRFREELEPVIQRRKRRRHYRVLGLCAGVLLFGLVGLLALDPFSPLPAEILVTRALGNTSHTGKTGETGPARPGSRLEVGSLLATADRAYLALQYNGYDLRLNSHSRIRIEAGGVHLLAGEVYVSNETGRGSARAFAVHTAYATVRDIGTQFTVRLGTGELVTTVRRGSIVINTEGGEHTAEAGGKPRRVSVDQQQTISAADVDAEPWTWIYPLAPAFELDGSSAYDFLRWSVAESGRQLQFARPAAETYSRITTLHGDISKLDPEQAVAPVLATTHLRARVVEGNTLLVSLLPR